MTGFIVTTDQHDAIAAALDAAQESRGRKFLHLGAMLIHTGEHAGGYFIGLADKDLTQKLSGIQLTDYPEFQQIIASLGGLYARVDIDPSILIDPNAPTDP